ncbi:phosphoenolpyruvate hydrolase family protein [Clostridium polynesiense]|uniref:phosphoenolpyruvate hydrolase family protein n=1 Tax=Clostridium polynesiense TaxID=1325933 RepID=UPI000AC56EBC|nr:phosphoenolpyruvate hydrolase family protein [Clostridium polynesiense]
MNREAILRQLKSQIRVKGHIIGVAAGGGMTAKYAALGGASFILALSAGKYRQMGRSSLASFLCYENNNEVVMDFGIKELLTTLNSTPVIFGLNATDPNIKLKEYIKVIKERGFSGVNNFPTMGLIDGKFREALEEAGLGYDKEVEAIRLAHEEGLFTLAFVFDEGQAEEMALAGADIICAHFGLTEGGRLGARKVLSLEMAKERAEKVYNACEKIRPGIIKMAYGGPIKTPIDAQYIYNCTQCQGYIGGSSFERIPTERAILDITKAFNSSPRLKQDDLYEKMLSGNVGKYYDYVDFIKAYVDENYMTEIHLGDLAMVAHVNVNYLSTKFKKAIGCSFTEYLIKYRLDKAAELIMEQKYTLLEISRMVGYNDYAQFSKMFKKYKGCPPKKFLLPMG